MDEEIEEPVLGDVGVLEVVDGAGVEVHTSGALAGARCIAHKAPEVCGCKISSLWGALRGIGKVGEGGGPGACARACALYRGRVSPERTSSLRASRDARALGDPAIWCLAFPPPSSRLALPPTVGVDRAATLFFYAHASVFSDDRNRSFFFSEHFFQNARLRSVRRGASAICADSCSAATSAAHFSSSSSTPGCTPPPAPRTP